MQDTLLDGIIQKERKTEQTNEVEPNKRFIEFVKENESLIAIGTTLAGALLTATGNLLKYYYLVRRFNLFRIPKDYISSYNNSSIISILLQYITLVVPIIIALFYFYNTNKFVAKNDLFKKPFIVPFWKIMVFGVLLSPINAFYVSTISYPQWLAELILCAFMGFSESLIGVVLLSVIYSYRFSKNSVSKRFKRWFFIYYFVVIFAISIILSSKLPIYFGGTYQITDYNNTECVAIATNDSYAILEKCKESKKENKTFLKVDTNSHTIVSLDGLTFDNKTFNKIELENKK